MGSGKNLDFLVPGLCYNFNSRFLLYPYIMLGQWFDRYIAQSVGLPAGFLSLI